MFFRKFVASIIMAMGMGITGFVPSSLALASSQNQSSEQKYSTTEIQNALRQNIERYYYIFKDKPIKNPEHKVSQVKILHNIQHGQKVILVGSCLVDGKEHLITGGLGRDKTTRELMFGGGWRPTSTINTPLYCGLGANEREMYISGKAFDKSITQLRLTPIPNGRPVVIPVNSQQYFAAVVPKAFPHSRCLSVSIEGLKSDGKVVYSTPQTSRNK